MKYFFFIVIGYIVLYLTVWLHEVGHSIVSAKYFSVVTL